jgi:hypothetical protein
MRILRRRLLRRRMRLRRLGQRAPRRPRLKPLDYVAALGAAALVALSFASTYASRSDELRVVVTGRGGEWVYPLETARTLEIDGPLGIETVRIEDSTARISAAPCANQTCVAMGAISRPGQWIACLPNRVFVRIEGGGADGRDVDASAY